MQEFGTYDKNLNKNTSISKNTLFIQNKDYSINRAVLAFVNGATMILIRGLVDCNRGWKVFPSYVFCETWKVWYVYVRAIVCFVD